MSPRAPFHAGPAAAGPGRLAAGRPSASELGAAAPQAHVSVGRLRLSLPAADGATAQRVATRAAALAAERLPGGLAGRLSGLSLKVRPRNLSEAALTEAVADALVAALRRRGGDRA